MELKVGQRVLMQKEEYPFNHILPAGCVDKNDSGSTLLIPPLSHPIVTYLANEVQ